MGGVYPVTPRLTSVSVCHTWFPHTQWQNFLLHSAAGHWGSAPGSRVPARAHYPDWASCKHTDDYGRGFSAGSISSRHYMPIKFCSSLLFVAMGKHWIYPLPYVMRVIGERVCLYIEQIHSIKCHRTLYTLSCRSLLLVGHFIFNILNFPSFRSITLIA